jgi:hypothetical protein
MLQGKRRISQGIFHTYSKQHTPTMQHQFELKKRGRPYYYVTHFVLFLSCVLSVTTLIYKDQLDVHILGSLSNPSAIGVTAI